MSYLQTEVWLSLAEFTNSNTVLQIMQKCEINEKTLRLQRVYAEKV